VARIAWAEWRPLGAITDEPPITPTVLIFHTMVGFLRGTDAFFRQQGFVGTESTFGLGGSWDGELDGALWQWQDMNRQADAQFEGNAYANSVETSDGGHPTSPWTSKQLESLVRLTVDWCRATGNPAQLVRAPHEHGLGWHEQFWAWNHGDHACPGPIREGQLRTIVIPRARAQITGAPQAGGHQAVPPTGAEHQAPTGAEHGSHPDGKVAVDGILGRDTTRSLQRVLHVDADGILGPATRVALQRHLGVRADSILGAITVKALQRRVHALQTGLWDRRTTRQLQRALNAGTF
jgi:N-acetylmuramoyl-L-alanine amidase